VAIEKVLCTLKEVLHETGTPSVAIEKVLHTLEKVFHEMGTQTEGCAEIFNTRKTEGGGEEGGGREGSGGEGEQSPEGEAEMCNTSKISCRLHTPGNGVLRSARALSARKCLHTHRHENADTKMPLHAQAPATMAATHCNTIQHPATDELRITQASMAATYCNTLQHTATNELRMAHCREGEGRGDEVEGGDREGGGVTMASLSAELVAAHAKILEMADELRRVKNTGVFDDKRMTEELHPVNHTGVVERHTSVAERQWAVELAPHNGIQIHVYIFVCINIYIYVYMHIYIHICTHMFIYLYTSWRTHG